MSVREVTVFEVVETKPMVCDLHHEHKRAKVLRRYELAVVETRVVENLWAKGYGQVHSGTGYRAVDQFGDEWRSDWDGIHGDGPSNLWTTEDGRRAERGGLSVYPAFDRPVAHDGHILLNPLPSATADDQTADGRGRDEQPGASGAHQRP